MKKGDIPRGITFCSSCTNSALLRVINMSDIFEDFEKRARFEDEDEADLIRQKLEILVGNILKQVEKQDQRFRSTLIQSGSVYEGVKVKKPDEFDFMVKLDSLTNTPLFYPCEKGDGYVKLNLDDDTWKEFKDEHGFFSPNLLCRHFKKLVNGSLSYVEVPEGLSIQRADQELLDGPWGPVFSDLLGNSGGTDDPSGVLYSETHGPATTLYIKWQGDSSYRNLLISVDLTLTLEYFITKLTAELSKSLPQSVDDCLRRNGFHVVPAGFDVWRISFSMAEKDVLSSSPEGFKACFRVLKIMRDTVMERLGLDAALVPSYIFKTALLSQLFITEKPRWEQQLRSQTLEGILEAILQGIVSEEINSFFLSRYNLLTKGDHENKLRRCILEEMLNCLRGFKMKYSPEDVKERKRQIRLLEMIDLMEYIVSSTLRGKDPTELWNKMFVNIGSVPGSRKFGWFWNQFTDLNSTELDEDAYSMVIRIWSLVEDFFKPLLASVTGELNLLVHKFYMRTREKKEKFEVMHKCIPEPVAQISLQEMACELFQDLAECYIDEVNSDWSSLHKAVPPEYKSSGVFQDVRDVTVNVGSDEGLGVFKQRIKQNLTLIPDSYLMSLAVGYVGKIFYHSRDVLKRKLGYITISELELD